MTTIEIRANYGITGHDGQIVFNDINACSMSEANDIFTVQLPDGAVVYENNMGDTMIKVGNDTYTVDELFVPVMIDDDPVMVYNDGTWHRAQINVLAVA